MTVNALKFKNVLNGAFREDGQQDPHEFLNNLLENFETNHKSIDSEIDVQEVYPNRLMRG